MSARPSSPATRTALLLALALAGAGQAHALVPQTGSSDQSGTATGVSTSPTVDRDRSDRVAPMIPRASGPAATLPHATAAVAASASALPLAGVRFDGASLPSVYLDAAAAPFVGKPVTPDNLKALADAIGTAYGKSDIAYYSVMIPAQTLTDGVLTVRVIEGAVTQYTLNGASYGKTTHLIGAHIKRIMADRPLRKSTLEREIALMRELPGQTIEAQMRQLDANGALAIDFKAHRRAVNISLTIDNDGVANVINSFQAQIAVTANNLLRDGDQTRVSSYLPIHPNRYQYYSISHSTPIGSNGITFAINGATLKTRSFDRQIEGKATLAGASLNYPLFRSNKTNATASVSIDGVNSSNYFLDTRFGDYHARAARIGASWSKADDKTGYAVSAVVSRGLGILGARAFTGFSEKTFTKVNVQAVAVKTIVKNLTFKLSTRAQYSNDMLPVTERVALGGPGAGRAFQVGDVTAEKAVAGMLEIAWSLPTSAPKILRGTSIFTFADGAVAGTVARPVYGLPTDHYTLASVGAGVRVAISDKWRASAEVAVPVKRPTPYAARKARVFFGLGRTF